VSLQKPVQLHDLLPRGVEAREEQVLDGEKADDHPGVPVPDGLPDVVSVGADPASRSPEGGLCRSRSRRDRLRREGPAPGIEAEGEVPSGMFTTSGIF
jgi:hypothetical protein